MSNNASTRNVVKQLAGAEDLLFGAGLVTQTRGGVAVQVHRLDLFLSLQNEAELATTSQSRYPKVRIGQRLFVSINGEYQELYNVEPVLFNVGSILTADFNYCANDDVVAKWLGPLPKVLNSGDAAFAGPNWQIIGGGGSAFVDKQAISLKALPIAGKVDGEQWLVANFYEGWAALSQPPQSGGIFAWHATLSKATHNGVTHYAPEAIVAWLGTRADLATLLNWTGSGSGVWVRLKPAYSVLEAGGGDGINDDSLVLQKLFSVCPPGGTVSIVGAKCVIDTSFSVLDLRSLRGDWKNPDMAGPANAPYYNVATSAIYLNSAATITLGQSSAIQNVLIYRKGMSFPVANDAAFVGTALASTAGTACLSEILVMGFNKLFVGTGQRYIIDRVYGDNKNGIEISGSPDVCYISRCHMWPFAANTLVYPNDAANRSGTGYYFHDVADWVKISDCFSYAYKYGFDFLNVNNMSINNCSADHNFPNSQGGSIGMRLRGTCKELVISNPQVAGQHVGILLALANETYYAAINGGALWSNVEHSILVTTGSAKIGGNIMMRDAPTAIGIASAASYVEFDDAIVKSITNPFVVPVYTDRVKIGRNIRYESVSAGVINTNNVLLPNLASAGNINLPASGDTFGVTGIVAIQYLTGFITGRRLTLIFNEPLTVLHGGTGVAGLRLKGNANFVTAEGSVLTLIHNGFNWHEVSRSE